MHPKLDKFPLRLDEAALIVIDMQEYFLNRRSHAYLPKSKRIILRLKKLISLFKKINRPIIFTRHIDRDKYGLMCRWWGEAIEEGDPLSRISDRLDTSGAEVIIKHQYDAFLGTPLEEMLHKMGVRQVIITGVVAHLCCETTARSAFMRGFETFFVTDCTASSEPGHKKAAILNLSHGFAVPITHKYILELAHGDGGD